MEYQFYAVLIISYQMLVSYYYLYAASLRILSYFMFLLPAIIWSRSYLVAYKMLLLIVQRAYQPVFILFML